MWAESLRLLTGYLWHNIYLSFLSSEAYCWYQTSSSTRSHTLKTKIQKTRYLFLPSTRYALSMSPRVQFPRAFTNAHYFSLSSHHHPLDSSALLLVSTVAPSLPLSITPQEGCFHHCEREHQVVMMSPWWGWGFSPGWTKRIDKIEYENKQLSEK